MEIRINGKTADITADSEKTVGEIMAGLEQWLAASGHRLSGIAIDGQHAGLSSLEEVFGRDIDTVNVLDISTSSLAELAAQSLALILGDIDTYESLGFAQRPAFYESWKESPQALLAADQMPDLLALCGQVFSEGGASSQMLRAIVGERLSEVRDPGEVFKGLGPLVAETCARLIDLPLDIQTGKDGRTAQTIQIFAGIAEKIIRVFGLLTDQGYIAKEPVAELIGKFGEAVRELLTAYEKYDTVLVGDLTEYEMAPRLQELYDAIAKGIK
jgi:hypothetical protein